MNPTAAALGYGGLIPFAAGVVALAAGVPSQELAAFHLVAYGAVILSFIGAVHWGVALGLANGGSGLLIGSVVPSLIGWVSLLLPAAAGMPLQVLCFAALYAYERKTLWPSAFPAWYRKLRTHLTLAVATMMAVAWGLVLVQAIVRPP